MNTTLVINPKGGAGKTTVAINLASHFAASNTATTLMDYDPQGSSLHWLRSRAPEAAKIHGANAAPPKPDRLRSFEMYVPPETRQLVIDRKSTRLNSSHLVISYAVFCLKKKKQH